MTDIVKRGDSGCCSPSMCVYLLADIQQICRGRDYFPGRSMQIEFCHLLVVFQQSATSAGLDRIPPSSDLLLCPTFYCLELSEGKFQKTRDLEGDSLLSPRLDEDLHFPMLYRLSSCLLSPFFSFFFWSLDPGRLVMAVGLGAPHCWWFWWGPPVRV